jgi:hypothetical protein
MGEINVSAGCRRRVRTVRRAFQQAEDVRCCLVLELRRPAPQVLDHQVWRHHQDTIKSMHRHKAASIPFGQCANALQDNLMMMMMTTMMTMVVMVMVMVTTMMMMMMMMMSSMMTTTPFTSGFET